MRIHQDAAAGQQARAAGALAYTVGNDIVWGAGVSPDSPAGRPLLAHELAHIAAGHTRARPETGFRDEAVLPTPEQRQALLHRLDPDRDQEPTGTVDEVAFTAALRHVGDQIRQQHIQGARDVQASPVHLTSADLDDLVPIAVEAVRDAYGSLLPAEIELGRVRDRVRFIPPADPAVQVASDEADLSADTVAGLARSDIRNKLEGNADAEQVLRDFGVQPGSARDRAMFARVVEAIRADSPDEWRTIALSARGWKTSSGLELIQRRIVPQAGESVEATRRRGRWLRLGTLIHETLHLATHRAFYAAVRHLRNRNLAVEGFTEFFTRPVYQRLIDRASGDPVFRLQVEGTLGLPMTPPARDSYTARVNSVRNHILAAVGNNQENLRQAYFRGSVEFIGLGHWNELARGYPVDRGHAIGGAILLRAGDTFSRPWLARASYGYLVWGHSGAVQLDLRVGAGMSYLSEGSRLGGGPETSVTLRGGNIYAGASTLLQGSTRVSGAGLDRPGAEAVFGLEAGFRYASFQVGPTIQIIVPITDRDAADRSVQVFGGIGASFVLGR